MKRGFDHRLLPPYRIVKDKEKDEEFVDVTEEGMPLKDYPTEQQKEADETAEPSGEHIYGHKKGGYDQVDNDKDDMVAEHEEEDITWRMSDFQLPPVEPLSYD